MKKFWLQFVYWFNNKTKNFSIRLVKWTGKSKQYIHPKHLTGDESHFWFTPYLKPDDSLLDLGCGGGAHAMAAARIVKQVVAVDYNQRNLQIADKLIHVGSFQNIKLKQVDLESALNEKAESFTAVLALDILEHLNNRDQFMLEIHRILQKDGLLFLSVPNRSTNWKKSLEREGLFYYSDWDHKYEYEKDEIEKILKECGYDILVCEPTVLDTPLVGLIDVLGGISLTLYKHLSEWKRTEGIKRPEEATGFRIVARKLL